VAIQNLPVVFALDRAGLVGADGATHAGAYDIPFLRCIPNMSIACPADERECRQLLTSAYEQNHPVAVRYPRGAGAGVAPHLTLDALPFGKGEVRREGKRIAILAFGTLLYPALHRRRVARRHGGQHALGQAAGRRTAAEGGGHARCLVTLEEGAIMGGAGSAVLEALQAANVQKPVLQLGLPDRSSNTATRPSCCGHRARCGGHRGLAFANASFPAQGKPPPGACKRVFTIKKTYTKVPNAVTSRVSFFPRTRSAFNGSSFPHQKRGHRRRFGRRHCAGRSRASRDSLAPRVELSPLARHHLRQRRNALQDRQGAVGRQVRNLGPPRGRTDARLRRGRRAAGRHARNGADRAYYFTGKDPIFAFSCAVPFGLTARQTDSWKEYGNGRKLLDAFFAQYNFRTASAGNTGTQMGGWYRKEIKTSKT
jgi:hypothetical protein